jgi:hypothetical protein
LTATPRTERKVVTVFFCDLVGFTSRAESMDPEDVAALGIVTQTAEALIDSGRRAEGEAELEQALDFYRSVGATFYLARGEQLLAKAS